MSNNIGKNRHKILKRLSESRVRRLKETADKYEKLAFRPIPSVEFHPGLKLFMGGGGSVGGLGWG